MRIEPITISITTTRRNDVQSATITGIGRHLFPEVGYHFLLDIGDERTAVQLDPAAARAFVAELQQLLDLPPVTAEDYLR